MEMVWSSNFHFKPFLGQTCREREREREPRSRIRRCRRTPSSSPTIALTRSRRSHRTPCRPQYRAARSCRLISPSISPRLVLPSISPPRDLAFNLASARSRLWPTDLRPTDLSLWFWFLLLLWWCGSGVLVVVAFDCWSLLPWVELEFQWCVVSGFGCDFEIFCNKICLDAEKIADKIWKICRKIAFLE